MLVPMRYIYTVHVSLLEVKVEFTQWNGTAFDCTNFNSEILLSHESFQNPDGANKSCNGGQITGRSLRIENNSYIFQLSVTTSTALNVVPIGKTVLTVISGEKLTIL